MIFHHQKQAESTFSSFHFISCQVFIKQNAKLTTFSLTSFAFLIFYYPQQLKNIFLTLTQQIH